VAVDELHLAFQVLPRLSPAAGAGEAHLQPLQVEPGPAKADGQQQQQGVEQPEKEVKAGAQGVKSYHAQQDQYAQTSLAQHSCFT
jgi:hypothetical protein